MFSMCLHNVSGVASLCLNCVARVCAFFDAALKCVALCVRGLVFVCVCAYCLSMHKCFVEVCVLLDLLCIMCCIYMSVNVGRMFFICRYVLTAQLCKKKKSPSLYSIQAECVCPVSVSMVKLCICTISLVVGLHFFKPLPIWRHHSVF